MKRGSTSQSLTPVNDEIAKRRLIETMDEVSFDVGLADDTDSLEPADPVVGQDALIGTDAIGEEEVDEEFDGKSFSEQFSDIVEGAKALAETEIAYYQAKVEANIGATKRVFAFFGIGLALSTAGLTALILGLLMTLAPYVGPGLATLIVAGLSIGTGGLFMLNAVKRAKKLPIGRTEL